MTGAAKGITQTLKFVLWLGLASLSAGFMAKAVLIAFRAGWGLM